MYSLTCQPALVKVVDSPASLSRAGAFSTPVLGCPPLNGAPTILMLCFMLKETCRRLLVVVVVVAVVGSRYSSPLLNERERRSSLGLWFYCVSLSPFHYLLPIKSVFLHFIHFLGLTLLYILR